MLLWTITTRPAIEAKANLVKDNHNKVVEFINNEVNQCENEEDKLTIFNEAPSLKLDALDVQILDDSLALKKPPVLTGVETLI